MRPHQGVVWEICARAVNKLLLLFQSFAANEIDQFLLQMDSGLITTVFASFLVEKKMAVWKQF